MVDVDLVPLIDEGLGNLLERAGHRDLVVLDGGPEDWSAATGSTLETGA